MYTLPNAKINIGLRVVGRRPDGYHDLQTVFYPISLADSLEIKPAPHLRQPYEFILSGLPVPADGKPNLVERVFISMQEEFRLPPTSIFLCKHIPVGAGLGGGSSDAAHMMRLLNECYRLDISDAEMEQRLAAFGADCPFFVRNKPVYAEGTGNRFTPIKLSLKGTYIVLVKPPIHVSTPEAYAEIDRKLLNSQSSIPKLDLDIDSGIMPVNSQFSILKAWRTSVTNDFEPVVFARYPRVAAIKQTLYDMGALYASMSGSGSAVYGLFSRPIENAATVFPDCFTFSGTMM